MIVEQYTTNFADLVMSGCRTRPAMGDGRDDAQALIEIAAILETRAEVIDPGRYDPDTLSHRPKLQQAVRRVQALRRVADDLLLIASRIGE